MKRIISMKNYSMFRQFCALVICEIPACRSINSDDSEKEVPSNVD